MMAGLPEWIGFRIVNICFVAAVRVVSTLLGFMVVLKWVAK